MANQLYKNCLLVWAAVHDKRTNLWIPAITISWHTNGKYQFHRFNGPPETSYALALSAGKQLAESWVDEKGAKEDKIMMG
jgi:hypothetical protein